MDELIELRDAIQEAGYAVSTVGNVYVIAHLGDYFRATFYKAPDGWSLIRAMRTDNKHTVMVDIPLGHDVGRAVDLVCLFGQAHGAGYSQAVFE